MLLTLIYLYGKYSGFGLSKVVDWILIDLQVNTFSMQAELGHVRPGEAMVRAPTSPFVCGDRK